MYFMSICCAIE